MKELSSTPGPETAIVVKKQQEQELHYDGSMNLKPGQKLWRFNIATQELTEVKLEKEKTFDLASGDPTPVTKITADPKSRYVVALNRKNAMKKILLQFGWRWDEKNKMGIPLFRTETLKETIYLNKPDMKNTNPGPGPEEKEATPPLHIVRDAQDPETENTTRDRLQDGVDEGAPDDDFKEEK